MYFFNSCCELQYSKSFLDEVGVPIFCSSFDFCTSAISKRLKIFYFKNYSLSFLPSITSSKYSRFVYCRSQRYHLPKNEICKSYDLKYYTKLCDSKICLLAASMTSFQNRNLRFIKFKPF